MNYKAGDIISADVFGPWNGGEKRRVTGLVKRVSIIFVEGNNYERIADAEDLCDATQEERVSYWLDRAISAELSGCGSAAGHPEADPFPVVRNYWRNHRDEVRAVVDAVQEDMVAMKLAYRLPED